MLVDVQAVEQRERRLNARLFMIERAGCVRRSPPSSAACRGRGRRRRSITRNEARPIEVAVQLARFVDDDQRVRPDVTLRVPLRLLLAADQATSSSGKDSSDDAEIEREPEADRRMVGLQQKLLDLAPDPFGG